MRGDRGTGNLQQTRCDECLKLIDSDPPAPGSLESTRTGGLAVVTAPRCDITSTPWKPKRPWLVASPPHHYLHICIMGRCEDHVK